MKSIVHHVEELSHNIQAYINTRIDEMKLDLAEKSSSLLSNFIATLTVAVMFFFCLMLGSIALSIVLGEWLGKMWLGFLIVSICFLVIAILVWYGRRALIQLPMMNSILKQLFNQDEEDKTH